MSNAHTLTSRPSPEDEPMIGELVEQLAERWNAGDGEGYAGLFWDDADYIAVEGSHLQGRDAIATVHQHLFDTRFKGSRLEGHLVSCRFVAPTVALVHRTGSVWIPGDRTEADGKGTAVQTLVAVQRDKVWRFAAFQNTSRRQPSRSQFAG